ncbi:hypothetical protein NPIL_643121 [Nephila pilipes]|uniref:Uncharacterized protein n=1 Tax=Nephila pilipes TaxID=299642 RepID=A0A8X6PUC7_NEPPI|nr:hypothetical protein NPIL_643121 [Nephila pilipes]
MTVERQLFPHPKMWKSKRNVSANSTAIDQKSSAKSRHETRKFAENYRQRVETLSIHSTSAPSIELHGDGTTTGVCQLCSGPYRQQYL